MDNSLTIAVDHDSPMMTRCTMQRSDDGNGNGKCLRPEVTESACHDERLGQPCMFQAKSTNCAIALTCCMGYKILILCCLDQG